MARRLRLVRGLLALVVGVGIGLVASSGTAVAAACSAGTGVTVVVGSSVGCDANGGGVAASNFTDAGHSLTYARREPGFVCRVDNSPASDPCVNASPTDAYWALFWSDGKSGTWTYSNTGVGGLTVPTGGWVAFVFQTSNARTYPSMTPRTAAPAPTSRPTSRATKAPATTPPTRLYRSTERSTPGSGSPSAGSTTASPGSSATPSSAAPGTEASASPSAGTKTEDTASASGEDDVERTSAEADPASGSSALVWVGLALAIALAAGTMLTVSRRRAGRQ